MAEYSVIFRSFSGDCIRLVNLMFTLFFGLYFRVLYKRIRKECVTNMEGKPQLKVIAKNPNRSKLMYLLKMFCRI